jgi:outer membrane cobalamin receptor
MRYPATIIAILLFACHGAFCEEATTLAPVVVEEKYEAPPLGFPSAFSTVIETEDFGGEFKTASELLSFSPGVQIRDFGGFGQLKTASIRGSSADQVVILLDGARISSPLGGGVDLSTIPLEYVDRFEVVRGGASALAGTDAIGGVINIVTKKATEPFSKLSIAGGAFRTLTASLSRAGRLGKGDYFLSLSHASTEGDFKFKSINDLSVTRINNEFVSESALGKLTQPLPGGWELTLLNEFYFDRKGVPGLGEFQEDSSRQTDVRDLGSARLKKSGLFHRDLDFDLNVFARFDMLKFRDKEPTVGLPIDTLSRIIAFGANPAFTFYAPFNQTVSFGSEARVEVLRNDDFGNPWRYTLSAFLGDELALAGDHVLISPVVRLDVWRTMGAKDKTDASLSPKLGVVIKPVRFLALKGNVSRSFRAPSFSELFQPEQGFIGGNPDLVSEKSIDFDAGLVLGTPRASLALSYFRSRTDDLIMFVFVSARRIEPRNLDRVTQQGVEASLVARPLSFFELYAAYTYLDGEIRDTGAQLPGRAKNLFDLRATLSLGVFKLYWESHFVDKIPLSPFPDSPATEARWTHDAGAGFDLKRGFFTASAKNIFNNLRVRDAFDFPLPGFQVYATAGLRF